MHEDPEITQTVRKQIINLLLAGDFSAGEISQAVRIREKEVYDHLAHISRSVSAQNKRLAILPIHCLSCGYTFKDRKHFTRPSRCPLCKSRRIETPRYRIY